MVVKVTDRTTINVDGEAHRTAREAKHDGETWGDFLLRCAEADRAPVAAIDPDALADLVVERIPAEGYKRDDAVIHEAVRDAANKHQSARKAGAMSQSGPWDGDGDE